MSNHPTDHLWYHRDIRLPIANLPINVPFWHNRKEVHFGNKDVFLVENWLCLLVNDFASTQELSGAGPAFVLLASARASRETQWTGRRYDFECKPQWIVGFTKQRRYISSRSYKRLALGVTSRWELTSAGIPRSDASWAKPVPDSSICIPSLAAIVDDAFWGFCPRLSSRWSAMEAGKKDKKPENVPSHEFRPWAVVVCR